MSVKTRIHSAFHKTGAGVRSRLTHKVNQHHVQRNTLHAHTKTSTQAKSVMHVHSKK